MRPLKLKITAFGPYATQQIIDFTELQGRNLFVITGDTGAGKTTILDAIAYALYGKASGQDRDGESLRSHFAVADLITAVELEFELQGECYWVRRIPKQRKKRVRSLGYIDQNAEAEFKKLDDKSAVVCGVREVNEKIMGLIGLSYEQFKQIIMIPQGEFRELLTADSKTRQDILQKIFGTEGFYRVQELLEDQAKNLSQEVNNLHKQRDEYIRSFDKNSYPGLAAALAQANYNIPLVIEEAQRTIELDRDKENSLQEQVVKQEEKITDKQGEIFQSKANNLKINARDEAYEKRNILLAGQLQIEDKKLKVKQGRKALGLMGVDANCHNRLQYVEKKERELLQANLQRQEAEKVVEISQKNYQLEKEKEEKYSQLVIQQVKLQELRVKVADWDARQAKNTQLEQQLAMITKNREAIKKELEKTRSEITDCQKNLDKAREVRAKYTLAAAELEKVNSICTKFKSAEAEQTDVIHLEQSALHLQQRAFEAQIRNEQVAAEYQEAQKSFLQGQAGIIASQIKAGHSCPVCGSEHHPRLASLLEAIPSEAKLQELGKQQEQTRQEYEGIRGNWESSKAECYTKQQILLRMIIEIKELIEDDSSIVSMEKLGEYIAQELTIWQEKKQQLTQINEDLLQQEKDQEVLFLLLVNRTELAAQLAKESEELEEKHIELFAKCRSGQDAMKELEAEVPIEMRSMKNLLNALQGIENSLKNMKQALERVEGDYRDSQVGYAAAVSEEKIIEKSLKEGLEELRSARQAFMDAMLHAGFNGEEEYFQAKQAEKDMKSLEEQINNYYEELRSVTDSYQQLQQEVEHLSLIDIKAVEEEYHILQVEKKELVNQHAAIMARKSHNERTLRSISALGEKTMQKTTQHQLIGHLAKIAKGDNEEKVSFERYVLAAFFNDIINAANNRLKKMTGGRYQMNRIAQKGKGGGQSGLEIEVLDYYTGQYRHVKTLSGGESFKASLALALGLAEVVQSYAGGISLDTMFVDEGFGTLDPESLDTAIACLMELQHSGRLVGIISHVPELKENIDARLEIKASTDGSFAQFSIR